MRPSTGTLLKSELAPTPGHFLKSPDTPTPKQEFQGSWSLDVRCQVYSLPSGYISVQPEF